MSTFLDARTSQNASTAGSIAIPITVLNTPQLWAQLGLITAGAGANPRAIFTGTMTVTLPLALVGITITVVRGTAITDPVIFSATSTFELTVLAPQIITFTAADYLPPITPQLTYTAFVSSNLLGTVRVGPESFQGILVSD
ncbi:MULTISPECIES: hypothetical protein [Paenibacillus]|uniref:hypothetical protein n=1 Tax=Paenibacillus TaxID=44249 RepID=UPI000429A83B|nr:MULTISPECIES: hypothetical protein [Paenibacillus]KKC46930.1 hypothetical protein VE23_06920 [Paenibacillus sp. D9]CDN41213.1 Uncharacterized protein BN871_AC_01070 [Paenibacillus sp. P22]